MEGWTFAAVEQRLIEAAELWQRTPASGPSPSRRSPFASDAPWERMTNAARADAAGTGSIGAWRLEQEAAQASDGRPSRRGLTVAEVAQRDEASAWLRLIPDEHSRRIVSLAIAEQARTGQRVQWRKLLPAMGLKLGADGLRMRYSRAITTIVRQLERDRAPLAA